MAKWIIWENPETGGVSITKPAYVDEARQIEGHPLFGFSDQELIDHVIGKDLPEGARFVVIEDNHPSLKTKTRDAMRIADFEEIVLPPE
jgi:prephenate dehydrogenase